MRRKPSSAAAPGADPAGRVDEMGLHVDHRRVAAERVVGRFELELRAFGHRRRSRRRARGRSRAASPPCRADRARGRAPTSAAGPRRRSIASRGVGERAAVGRAPGERRVLVARPAGGAAAARPVASSADRNRRKRYSARSSTAVSVRAAWRPGIAATRLARTARRARRARSRAPGPSARARRGSDGRRDSRARARARCPAGMPMIVPIATATVDCHATTPASCRRVKPNVLSSARSRRRRRTDVTSVSASATTAPAASAAPRYSGVRAHRAVVHDLGRALHRRSPSRPSSSAGSACPRSRPGRGARATGFTPRPEAHEDGLRAGR